MNYRTIQPLPSMPEDHPVDLDSFLPEHVAQPVHDAMQRMRAVAMKAENREGISTDEMRQYSADAKQVIALMSGYLSSDDCPIDPATKERLLQRGNDLAAGSSHIGEMADLRDQLRERIKE